jgi:hypothetical protein
MSQWLVCGMQAEGKVFPEDEQGTPLEKIRPIEEERAFKVQGGDLSLMDVVTDYRLCPSRWDVVG